MSAGSIVEALLLAAALGAGLLVLVQDRSRRVRTAAGGVALGLAVAACAGRLLQQRSSAAPAPVPAEITREGFTRSEACQACHPDEHATWRASYHRTMTQRATPESVVASFEGQPLSARGRTFRPERRGEELWIALEGSDGANTAPVERARVVLTTGSHVLQAYWTEAPGGELVQFPWVWRIGDRRWIPSADSFLRPEGPDDHAVWNRACILCHTTGGVPGQTTEGALASRVSDLSIACEACHGPGEEHVRANRDPARRYRLHLAGTADETIVNPARLPSQASARVCGQCHALVRPADVDAYLAGGGRYRPGDPLEGYVHVTGPTEPGAAGDAFWPDGTVRIGGREYNGLLASACYQRGALSCLSCHSMHVEDPDHQMAPGMRGDRACLQCHQDLADRVEAHTHHPAGSPGAACYACHMPPTSFALLGAIRSHRIDSPAPDGLARTARPNACNLCHLDQTLDWTMRRLVAWYGGKGRSLSPEERSVAAGPLWLLTGDAAQRAVVAWSFGRFPARDGAADWRVPWLAMLLDDPYAAVRHVAARSLRSIPDYADLRYDFIDPREERIRVSDVLVERWTRQRARATRPPVPELLIDGWGQLRWPELRALRQLRDDQPVVITE